MRALIQFPILTIPRSPVPARDARGSSPMRSCSRPQENESAANHRSPAAAEDPAPPAYVRFGKGSSNGSRRENG